MHTGGVSTKFERQRMQSVRQRMMIGRARCHPDGVSTRSGRQRAQTGSGGTRDAETAQANLMRITAFVARVSSMEDTKNSSAPRVSTFQLGPILALRCAR